MEASVEVASVESSVESSVEALTEAATAWKRGSAEASTEVSMLPWELSLLPWKLSRFHGRFHCFHESFHGIDGSSHVSFHELSPKMKIVQVAQPRHVPWPQPWHLPWKCHEPWHLPFEPADFYGSPSQHPRKSREVPWSLTRTSARKSNTVLPCHDQTDAGHVTNGFFGEFCN